MRIIKCTKSLGIGTGLGSSSFKTTDFFCCKPFYGMFIICEPQTCELLKCEPNANSQSHWSTDGSHMIRTICILVLKIDILRPAPCLAEVEIYYMYLNVDENEIKSLVSTIPLTYVRTEGGRRKICERIRTILKCESMNVRKYQA